MEVVLVVTRYVVPLDEAAAFHGLGRAALQALTARPGCTAGFLARSVDDPTMWTLTTTWASTGDYRRALGAYDVKVHAVPLMYRALDEPTAYEPLVTWTASEGVSEQPTTRSLDADTVGLGEAATALAPRDVF